MPERIDYQTIKNGQNKFISADETKNRKLPPLNFHAKMVGKPYGNRRTRFMIKTLNYSVPVRAIVADDHPLALLAVESLVSSFPNMEVVGCATDRASLFAETHRAKCNLAVMDLYMPSGPDADGVEMIRQYKELYPDVPVVVLTMETTATAIQEVVSLGVGAVVSKRDRINLLHVAIVSAMEGDCYLGPTIRALLDEAAHDSGANPVLRVLSKRELEVLTHFATGLSLTEIACRVGRSVKTISAQKRMAMRKLSLPNDVELYCFAVKHFSRVDSGSRNAPGPGPKRHSPQASIVRGTADE